MSMCSPERPIACFWMLTFVIFSLCFDQHLLRFGVKNQDLPHPEADWSAFSAAISLLNDKEPMVWNSIAKKTTKWVDMAKLTKAYGRNKQGGKQGSSGGGTDIGDACCTVA